MLSAAGAGTLLTREPPAQSAQRIDVYQHFVSDDGGMNGTLGAGAGNGDGGVETDYQRMLLEPPRDRLPQLTRAVAVNDPYDALISQRRFVEELSRRSIASSSSR